MKGLICNDIVSEVEYKEPKIKCIYCRQRLMKEKPVDENKYYSDKTEKYSKFKIEQYNKAKKDFSVEIEEKLINMKEFRRVFLSECPKIWNNIKNDNFSYPDFGSP